jgi:hypothetical protein
MSEKAEEQAEEEKSGFAVQDGKGFSLAFKNGWHISVQFGGSNYCANRHKKVGVDFSRVNEIEQHMNGQRVDGVKLYTMVLAVANTSCADAEIMIWCSVPRDVAPLAKLMNYTGGCVNFGHDTVEGWVTPDTVGQIIAALQASEGFVDHEAVQEQVREIVKSSVAEGEI